MTIADTF